MQQWDYTWKIPHQITYANVLKSLKELSAIQKGFFSTSSYLLGVDVLLDPDKQSPSASSEVSKMVDETRQARKSTKWSCIKTKSIDDVKSEIL